MRLIYLKKSLRKKHNKKRVHQMNTAFQMVDKTWTKPHFFILKNAVKPYFIRVSKHTVSTFAVCGNYNIFRHF